MGKIKGWTKREKTNFISRWDHVSGLEIHIVNTRQITASRKKDYYFVEGSDTVGGFFSIGDAKTKKEAEKIAIDYMKSYPR